MTDAMIGSQTRPLADRTYLNPMLACKMAAVLTQRDYEDGGDAYYTVALFGTRPHDACSSTVHLETLLPYDHPAMLAQGARFGATNEDEIPF